VTEIWDLLGHKRIRDTLTIEWLSPGVGLVRFLYSGPAEYPYRGVVNVHITGDEYEFKGMVFHAKNDAITFAENRAIKRYLRDMGLVGKSRRLKNGNVVMKVYGNSAKTNCGEMKMSGKVQEGRLLVKLALSAENADGTVFANHGHEFNMTRAQFAYLQDSVDNGTMADLKKLRDDELAKAAA
jgi:hypothetical protein